MKRTDAQGEPQAAIDKERLPGGEASGNEHPARSGAINSTPALSHPIPPVLGMATRSGATAFTRSWPACLTMIAVR